MKRLFDFVYGNFMTLFNRVVENIKELSPMYQAAFALIVVALIFIAVMILIYILRISKYRTVKEIENVDVVFFNSVWEFPPYKRGKQGEIVFILLIPFTFAINLVVKIFMFRSFDAINSSDYITRRMLENMQLENMRLKDKNKDLLKLIDEAGLNKKKRPAPKPKRQEPPKEEPKKVEPKKEEPKQEAKKTEEPPKEEPKVEEVKKETAPIKEEQKKEEPIKVEPKKEEPKQAAPKVEEVKEVKEEAVTSSTIVTEKDKEPEVILSKPNIEEPITPQPDIIEAEIIDPDQDKLDELIDLVSTKETRGKA